MGTRAVSWALIIAAAAGALIAGLLWYSIVFPRQPFRGPLPAATAAETDLSRRLAAHVGAIAREPRNLDHYAELEVAAGYIETTLSNLGYTLERQVYSERGVQVRNIEVVLGPSGAGGDVGSYVVGAHYDSAGFSPGANDNGTGVAATLELARLLRDLEPRHHRLRLVFWVNEEAPYGKTPAMGSFRHAEMLKGKGERMLGAISLETIGYFSDEAGSQNFPSPFDLVYENRGNFVAFVGLPGSRAFVHRVLNAFRATTAFPSIGGVAPGFIKGIDYSDHWSYHQMGYPALMVTDTAPFRNPQYHKTTDLPKTVDYDSLARVTLGIERVLRDLVAE